jgi:hypothetical protein
VGNDPGALVSWAIQDGTLSAATYVGTATSGWDYLDTGDYNGDGTTDILVGHDSGALVSWTIEDGTLSGSPTYIGTVTGGWNIII